MNKKIINIYTMITYYTIKIWDSNRNYMEVGILKK